MTRPLSISLALLAAAVLPSAASAAPTRIANPGAFTAHAVRCPQPDFACGGAIEFNGQTFGFDDGLLSGRVSSTGQVSRGAARFGVASTDRAVDGPLQLTFQPVATGPVSGRFQVNDTPNRAADADGLVFAFATHLYIAVGGPAVGPNCTIASPAAPLPAAFGGTLAGFFGTAYKGEPYNQASGITQETAVFQLPDAQNCNGLEQTVDQQLGLPGPGSVAIDLALRPIIQTNRYRAHRHHR